MSFIASNEALFFLNTYNKDNFLVEKEIKAKSLTWDDAEMATLDRIECRQKVKASDSKQDFIFQMHFKIISQISNLNLNNNFKN